MKSDRRSFLACLSVPIVAGNTSADELHAAQKIGLGFGTYGMKSLEVGQALRVCADIGFDGVELCLLSGWSTEPTRLSKAQRSEIRKQLADSGLVVPSLLESLPCLRTEQDHRQNIDKLKRATELAHDLAPSQPPVVQSIVGGKTSRWDQSKQQLVDQLADWAKIGEQSQTTVCFKPHASHAVHTPDRAEWVHRQVDSPRLKVVYDYSHFFLEGLSLRSTLEQLLPIVAYVQVKDSRGTPSKHEYLLPGDGKTNYGELIEILRQSGYQGFVGVEISSHIHRKPGYEPVPTAQLCYKRLSPYF